MAPPGTGEKGDAALSPSAAEGPRPRRLRAVEPAGAERGPERPPDNLPLELSSFVGCEREIAEVKRLLEVERLLTLTGPGGCGKTRLAVAVASDLAEDFEDGAWWVGPPRSPTQISSPRP